MFRLLGQQIILHTDNGLKFKNQKVREVCEGFGTRQVHGRARCPWIQVQAEHVNQTLKGMLSALVCDKPVLYVWIDELDLVVYRYITNIHSTTKSTPKSLFIGLKESKLANPEAIAGLVAYQEDDDEVNFEDPDENEKTVDIDPLSTQKNLLIINDNEIEFNANDVLPCINELKDEASLHTKAHMATDKATERVMKRRKWKNDHLDYLIGENVFLKEEFDINIKSKVRPLGDRLH